MPSLSLPFRGTDTVVLELLERAGRNTHSASLLLRDLLASVPDGARLARDLELAEKEGDRITHDVIHRLASRSNHGSAPFDAADGLTLARAVDDIVDHTEQAGDRLGLYAVEAPMEQALALSDVLVAASEQVARALRALCNGDDLGPHLVEIHRLENEGDRLLRDGVACLFANGIDPMVVIRWKDIFESIEAAVDACETVAHLLEGIALKRGL